MELENYLKSLKIGNIKICRLTDLSKVSGYAIHSIDLSNSLNKLGISDFVFSFGRYPTIKKAERFVQLDKDKVKIIDKIQKYHKIENFDLVHSHLINLDADIYHYIMDTLNVPIIVSLHFIISDVLSKYLENIIDKTDFFIAVSDSVKESAVKVGIPKNKIKVISTGVDLRIFDPSKYSIKECKTKFRLSNKPVITYVGSIQKEKGIEILIHAVSKLVSQFDCILNLCGSGQFEDDAKNICKKLNMTKNTFFWNLSRESIPEMLAASDIIVVPSLLPEALGKITLEAMAMKKPIIASRTRGYEELINNGINGILVKPNDIDGLSESLKILLEDKDKRNKISERARVDIKNSKHRFDYVVKNILELYLQILSTRCG